MMKEQEYNTSRTIGYMMNTYPVPSGTFIKSEILEHEKNGFFIKRYAARSWEGKLVDASDKSEARKTRYILQSGFLYLASSLLWEVISNPFKFLRCFRMAIKHALMRKSERYYAFFYLAEAVVLKRWSKQDKVSHIHAHFSTNATSIVMFSRILGGPTYSFTVHGPDEIPEMGINGIVDKVANAKFVVAITNFAKGEILKSAGCEWADKVKVIYCGIDMSLFSTKSVRGDIGGQLLCVGRLCPQKAQTMLVRTVIDLLEVLPDLRLDIIGDGETRGEIEALIANAGAYERIKLLGWGSAEDVRMAMERSRVFVLPSFAEGLPIVLMEAFAMARPVISTRIAGIPELLDESCGWIFEPGDSGALSQAIVEALESSIDELNLLGVEGQRRVKERHDVAISTASLRQEFSS